MLLPSISVFYEFYNSLDRRVDKLLPMNKITRSRVVSCSALSLISPSRTYYLCCLPKSKPHSLWTSQHLLSSSRIPRTTWLLALCIMFNLAYGLYPGVPWCSVEFANAAWFLFALRCARISLVSIGLLLALQPHYKNHSNFNLRVFFSLLPLRACQTEVSGCDLSFMGYALSWSGFFSSLATRQDRELFSILTTCFLWKKESCQTNKDDYEVSYSRPLSPPRCQPQSLIRNVLQCENQRGMHIFLLRVELAELPVSCRQGRE